MLVDGHDKCPTCGRPLGSRVLVRLVDDKSREIDFICFSEESWDWLQRTAEKFGVNEEQLIRLFAELYIESIRIRKMGLKYHVYYNELLKMLNLFHG
jgi:hypothetical protein